MKLKNYRILQVISELILLGVLAWGVTSVSAGFKHCEHHCHIYPSPTPTVSPVPSPTPEFCPEGYHEVWSTGKSYMDIEVNCVPDATPEPTPAPVPGTPVFFQQPDAHVCLDGNTVKVPLNFLAIRSGDKAELRWIPTEGPLVNVFYKNPKSVNWEHAVADQPNNGNLVVKGLGNHAWAFGLQQHVGCSGGPIANVVDGPQSRVFLFSYWSY